MDINSHVFSLVNLKEMLFESKTGCDEKISRLQEKDVPSQCAICQESVFGSHSVVVSHAPQLFFESIDIHVSHTHCHSQWLIENHSPESFPCPHPNCQRKRLPEITFSSVGHATQSGRIDEALQLIRQGVDPNAKQSCKGMAALHIASINGNKDVVRLLQVRDININIQDGDGNTALHHAVTSNNLDILKTLLMHKPDVNIRNRCNQTPLHMAAAEPEHPDLFATLMNHNARFDLPDNSRRLAIHYAAEAGHEQALKILVKNNADVNATARDGHTALHYATCFDFFPHHPRRKNRVELVRILIAAGARVELRTGAGYTAFDGAGRVKSESERIQFLRLLLPVAIDSFYDINAPANHFTKAYHGCSLLEYAFEARDLVAIRRLIDRGARITDRRIIKELSCELDDNDQNFIEMLNKAFQEPERPDNEPGPTLFRQVNAVNSSYPPQASP